MFTGIIENIGKVTKIEKEGTNVHLTLASTLAPTFKIDQSVSHNGVCLTVIAIEGNEYTVTAIEETLIKSNIGQLKIGDPVNLERAMTNQARLDGHMIQGHVDMTGTCVGIKPVDGSWYFTFEFPQTKDHIVVDKGSICVNGVSLTVVDPIDNRFSVAIIPFTYEHTTFGNLKEGDQINLEFDIIGKYIAKYIQAYLPKVQSLTK